MVGVLVFNSDHVAHAAGRIFHRSVMRHSITCTFRQTVVPHL